MLSEAELTRRKTSPSMQLCELAEIPDQGITEVTGLAVICFGARTGTVHLCSHPDRVPGADEPAPR